MTGNSYTDGEIQIRFTYHAPHGDQPERYMEIRGVARSLAECIVALAPDSRERTLAIEKLEEAVMWANAAIARREPRQ